MTSGRADRGRRREQPRARRGPCASPKTIEFSLERVYRKLGMRGRTELAALAVRRAWLDAPEDASHQD